VSIAREAASQRPGRQDCKAYRACEQTADDAVRHRDLAKRREEMSGAGGHRVARAV